MDQIKHTTIVIPVYADWSSLNDCIESLKKYLDTNVNKVMFINDCGPEADELEAKIKAVITGLPGYKYFRNQSNLGFLKTCNRAVNELDRTNNDILLLNSDTKVTSGFLEEMNSVLYSSEDIAMVTPRTNNATLATVPLSAAKQKGIEPQKSYEIFQSIKKHLPRHTEVPTGHGFCLLIRRNLIKKYGLFDEVFGKGYGEENDLSMRLKERGYKSALANQAYVFHLEARSFTLEAKANLLKENLNILYDRYPTYRPKVSAYMEEALMRETLAEEKAGVSYSLIQKTSFRDKIKAKLLKF